MRQESISSLKNPKVRNFAHLQKARERKSQNVFVIEGLKEIQKAVATGYDLVSVFYCPALIDRTSLDEVLQGAVIPELFDVTREVFQKIAYREDSGGIVVLARPHSHTLDSLRLPENPLVLVLESVEKPGNMGAVLRTADGAGVDAVIVCDPQTDVYNPNVVRSSLGCLFTVPLAVADSAEAIAWLRKHKIGIYCTYLEAAVPYHSIDFTAPSAIVMGTESTGLTEIWTKAANQNIIIPMQGHADSLNVSIAAAVVAYEALRQRTG